MTEWFVAKYMSDLRRREPRNVGVILSSNGHLFCRFYGERPSGELDGRRMKGVASSDNYRDWVHYWRSIKRVEGLRLVHGATDNYYLERGGQQIVGEPMEPAVLLEELYAQLVARHDNDEPERSDPVSELFAAVGQSAIVEPDPVIEIGLDVYPFDYGMPAAGRTLLFRRLAFNGSPRRTWDSLHAAADAVSQVADHLSGKYAPYVIGYEKDAGDELSKQVQALEKRLKGRFRRSRGLESDRAWLHSVGAPLASA
jgi:hypothetical protein